MKVSHPFCGEDVVNTKRFNMLFIIGVAVVVVITICAEKTDSENRSQVLAAHAPVVPQAITPSAQERIDALEKTVRRMQETEQQLFLQNVGVCCVIKLIGTREYESLPPKQKDALIFLLVHHLTADIEPKYVGVLAALAEDFFPRYESARLKATEAREAGRSDAQQLDGAVNEIKEEFCRHIVENMGTGAIHALRW